jgi:hypothetical protein
LQTLALPPWVLVVCICALVDDGAVDLLCFSAKVPPLLNANFLLYLLRVSWLSKEARTGAFTLSVLWLLGSSRVLSPCTITSSWYVLRINKRHVHLFVLRVMHLFIAEAGGLNLHSF